MKIDMKKLILIIPAYNEEDCLAYTIQEIEKYKREHSLSFMLDYIVVNDGSKDRTAEIARELKVKLLDLPVNLGLTGGFMTGMKYAVRNAYDYALQFDADGQHLPEFIPNMVEEAEKGANVVIGSRFVSQKRPNSLRMLGNVLISSAIKITTGKVINDPTSGMRLFDQKAMVFYITHSNMTPEPETISFMMKKKFRVEEVQVEMQDRVAGESYLNLRRSIQYMVRVAISILILQPFRR